MKRTLIAFVLIAVAIPAVASKKDDLYKAAQAAAGKGDVAEAARLYCAAAQEGLTPSTQVKIRGAYVAFALPVAGTKTGVSH